MSRWFEQTFIPPHSLSDVAHALMPGIDDITQTLSPVLTSATWARIQSGNNRLERTYLLFAHLDSQSGNVDLIRAFQQAVLRHGGVRYMLNGDLFEHEHLIFLDQCRARRQVQHLNAEPPQCAWKPPLSALPPPPPPVFDPRPAPSRIFIPPPPMLFSPPPTPGPPIFVSPPPTPGTVVIFGPTLSPPTVLVVYTEARSGHFLNSFKQRLQAEKRSWDPLADTLWSCARTRCQRGKKYNFL
ncbi:hypothetical protein C8F01DRAFT_1131104 [Mycena amicta]|nr:hypothetical protein C8F01DRAFT_1131104 [Mycena amicta]